MTEETVATSFEYRGSTDTTSVALVGSWDSWSEQTPMERLPDTAVWLLRKELPPGLVTFKFVTDGKWITGPAYDVVEDGFGGENNARVIASYADKSQIADVAPPHMSDHPQSQVTDTAKPPSAHAAPEKERVEDASALVDEAHTEPVDKGHGSEQSEELDEPKADKKEEQEQNCVVC